MLDESNYSNEVQQVDHASIARGEVKQITDSETKQILLWKILVILLMTVTAAMVSAGAYVFLSREEVDNYEDNYDQVVNTIREAAKFHSSNIFVTLRSFSHTLTGTAAALDQTFPYVSWDNFELLGAGVRSATGAEMVNWHPVVEDTQLEEWKNYTPSNYQQQLNQSRATALTLQAEGSSIRPNDFKDGRIAPFPYIPNFKEGGIILAPNYGPGPYYPAWQISPPIFDPNFINSNPEPWALKTPIAAVNQARRLVLTDSVPVENLANRAVNAEDHEKYHASLVDYVNDEGETAFLHPHSAVMVPVFETLNDPASRLVGTAVVVLPWDRYLVNLLPEGVNGITCVLRNSCGKAWTYDLEGNSAFYRGEGDFHQEKYNDTMVEIPFEDPTDPEGIERVPGECEYAYYIYATQEFEDQFTSNLPWALTLVVALTFALVILSFVVFNAFVQRRNKKVVGHATKTNALVNSLFPTEVKTQLLEHQEAKEASKNKKKNYYADPMAFMQDNSAQPANRRRDSALQGGPERAVSANNDPIANLYPECTVYFADLAGFTKWSSSRDPVDVFRLLEAIYSEFDALANRRGVFKVETIGDCYVAITGVPQPRDDHAVAMAKFASETRDKMRVVTKELVDTLGPDTADLELRIGLHSGPVTAGVLRGEKSRFQLFGDTVNTAARMESNGQRGKIQVSAETAQYLVEAGHDNWITPREDMIEAKGKGKLQTYWVEVVRGARSALSSVYNSSVVGFLDDESEGKEEPPKPAALSHGPFKQEVDV